MSSKISLRYWLIIFLMVAISIGLLVSKSLAGKQESISGPVREISVVAKKFAFTPDTIKVRLNEKVRLKIASEDVVHGFSIAEYGVNEIIEPGKETVIEFVASKKGTFRYFCSVECGTGHLAMQGNLLVE